MQTISEGDSLHEMLNPGLRGGRGGGGGGEAGGGGEGINITKTCLFKYTENFTTIK